MYFRIPSVRSLDGASRNPVRRGGLTRCANVAIDP